MADFFDLCKLPDPPDDGSPQRPSQQQPRPFFGSSDVRGIVRPLRKLFYEIETGNFR
jgi:hypothetical protein